MNMNEWFDNLKKTKQKKAMPILSFPAVSLMSITVNELISDSSLQATAMKTIADKVDSLASVSLMDLSVEAEAFGAKVQFSENEVPTVVSATVNSPEEADTLKVPKIGTARTGIYIEAIEKAKKLITDRPVFAGVIGPYSLAGRLMDVSEAMINCYAEPEMVHTVLEKVTEFTINYINAYKKAGADGIVMAEPLAGMLSPDLEKEFSAPYVKKIADAVMDDEFCLIYHNCGNNTIQMIDSILTTGCSAYHFGDSINMSEMLNLVPQGTIVMGNVSPTEQFKNGTPESIKKNTQEIMNECYKYSGFVISSGCDIPPGCSWDNITAFFEAVTEFNKKI